MGYLDDLYQTYGDQTAPASPTLPAGSVFDFDPHVSMTTDQSTNAASLTNSGSYTADADVLAKGSRKRVQFNGTNVITATCPPEIVDYTTDLPWTVYCVVRSSEFDEAAALFSIYAAASAATNRIYGQLVASNARTNRQRLDNASGSALEDDANGARAPGTIQILSYTFYSTSQGRKSVDNGIGSLQSYSSTRDVASDFDTIEVGGRNGGNVWDGDVFRLLVYTGDADQDVLDYLWDTYVKTDAAGSDLTAPSGGAITFDWSPTHTGDFASGRDSSGDRIHGELLPAGQFPANQRLDGGSYGGQSFDEANDEMISFAYPGAATLSACQNDRICFYVVFEWAGTGTDPICGLGDLASSTSDRMWLTYTQFGNTTANARDDGGTQFTSAGGNGPTFGAVVMAMEATYDNVGGMRIGAADSGDVMSTTQNAGATGDIALDTVVLAGSHTATPQATFDSVIRRLVVVEGAEYDATFANSVLSSVTP